LRTPEAGDRRECRLREFAYGLSLECVYAARLPQFMRAALKASIHLFLPPV
jgi:hypothetical protein